MAHHGDRAHLGYIAFGLGLAIIAFVVLFVFKRIEPLLYREHRAVLVLTTSEGGPSVEDIRLLVRRDGFQIANLSLDYRRAERNLRLHLQWSSVHGQTAVPAVLDELRVMPGIERLTWHPVGAGHLAE